MHGAFRRGVGFRSLPGFASTEKYAVYGLQHKGSGLPLAPWVNTFFLDSKGAPFSGFGLLMDIFRNAPRCIARSRHPLFIPPRAHGHTL